MGLSRREKEKTKSHFYKHQDPGEAWPPLSRTLGLGVSSAPSWDGESRSWGRNREPAMPPLPPTPVLEGDVSWRVLEFFFGQTLSPELNCHPHGKACVFSSCPLHTWCPLDTQWCQVSEAFQLPEQSASGSCKLPASGSIWRMLADRGHWHRGPPGVEGESGRGFGDCTECTLAEYLMCVGSEARRPHIYYFLWLPQLTSERGIVVPLDRKRNWVSEELIIFLKGCSRWLQSQCLLLSASHHWLLYWAVWNNGLQISLWLLLALWLEQVTWPLRISVSSHV